MNLIMSSSVETSIEPLPPSAANGEQISSSLTDSAVDVASFPHSDSNLFYDDQKTNQGSFKSSSQSGDSSDESVEGTQDPNHPNGSVAGGERKLPCNIVEPTPSKDQPDENGNQQRKRSETPSETENRDISYREKRRKNNESAKRSREARRMKEEATRYTADVLMVEHQTLKQEKANLEEEIRQLRMALSAYD